MIESTMPLHDHFCANLRRRRQELQMTQRELAAKMGVSSPYISQVESGDHTPTLDVVEKFAKALGCPSVTLLLAPDEATAGV